MATKTIKKKETNITTAPRRVGKNRNRLTLLREVLFIINLVFDWPINGLQY